jgi:bifunctional pyridoxal-dependent enzyme with beta-cystathionase and maltose regulon repressor activities
VQEKIVEVEKPVYYERVVEKIVDRPYEVQVEKPVYYETTKYVEDTDRINSLNTEIERFKIEVDTLTTKVRSIDEYSLRIREYDE